MALYTYTAQYNTAQDGTVHLYSTVQHGTGVQLYLRPGLLAGDEMVGLAQQFLHRALLARQPRHHTRLRRLDNMKSHEKSIVVRTTQYLQSCGLLEARAEPAELRLHLHHLQLQPRPGLQQRHHQALLPRLDRQRGDGGCPSLALALALPLALP